MKINEKKDYRSFFKRYHGIEFGSDYDIHHIDLNHKNNNINNLMILPKKLHQKYHSVLIKCGGISNNINLLILGLAENGGGWNKYFIQQVSEFYNVYYECQKWKDYTEYLKGNIPNIHNITLESKNGSI